MRRLRSARTMPTCVVMKQAKLSGNATAITRATSTGLPLYAGNRELNRASHYVLRLPAAQLAQERSALGGACRQLEVSKLVRVSDDCELWATAGRVLHSTRALDSLVNGRRCW